MTLLWLEGFHYRDSGDGYLYSLKSSNDLFELGIIKYVKIFS